MAVNGKITKTSFTDAGNLANGTETKVKAVHITELRTAISALEGYAKNVDNCGYTNCCESCQDTCACQSCQTSKCQSCQNACTCQSKSSKCQSCERCQLSQCNCGNSCSSCFIAGTKILMANGIWKPIEMVSIGEYVQGPVGINKVIGTQYTHLGNRRCIWTFNDKSIYFSGEHLFWISKKDKEFFGVVDMTQHLLEKDIELCPQYEGLTLSIDALVIDRPVYYATIDGWKHDEPIIARGYGNDTELYELVLDGSHMMFANGYLVAANAHDDDFDYNKLHWNGLKG